jgi:hypothetical protein
MSEHENIRRFLLENADAPVRYTLTKDPSLIEGILKNSEAASWLERLKQRSAAEDLSSIHGSHDYRIENILGKLWILGFDRNIPEFDASLQYILYFLRRHVKSPERGGGFGAIYSSLDYELLLAAYMPFFGYWDDEAVMHIALKRIGLLFDFFDKGNHDIYINPAGLKSVPKAWKEYILNPELYAGGNVKLPFIHDIILFAGMYNHTDTGCRHKIDAVIEWMCGESYRLMWKNKAVFYTEGGQYTSKAISVGAFPPDTDNTDGSFLFSAF